MPISLGTVSITALYLGTTSITSAYLGNTQVFGGSFTPLSLFSGGSQGIWLDPSDLTTMFVDRAGTTPVTAPGQLVGLRLDKSKGLVLGAELVTNGTFDSGTTGWTSGSGGTFVATAGQLVVTNPAGGTNRRAFQAFSATVGTTYRIEGQMVSGGRIGVGTTAAATETVLVSGSVNQVFTATASTMYVGLSVASATAGETATFDNISVRELPGNHATAATDAARPMYGVEPKGGRRNLLTWSEGFDNAVWVKAALTVTDNAEGIADKLTPTTTSFSHTVQATVSSSGVNTFTIEAKNAGYNFLNIAINNAAATAASYNLTTGGITLVGGSVLSDDFEDLGDGWGRLTLTATTTITSVRLYVSNAEGFAAFAGDGTSGVLVRKAQLELGSTATAYQRVTSAYDVTESGVATTHYVQYDGSDDSMSTAAIDFTATDKMSVFAGVRRLTNSAASVVLESSANVASNAGSFWLVSGDATYQYSALSRGSAAVGSGIDAKITSASFNPPSSDVVTSLHDIGGDSTSVRGDGVLQATATGDQGTGNFGNHSLFIGRRNNATLPFNGRDYGLIIVGKAASGTEITETETWLAAKTAQVTL